MSKHKQLTKNNENKHILRNKINMKQIITNNENKLIITINRKSESTDK